ncbi:MULTISPECIES: TetR/AcrR family transcriptional regulator [Kribbella]|jgi:AcrR family transcriptional regulator|uniref:TetR family transcriptional regulator n=1 Tax=Kribbella pratensis TaxID=2512112 RepID=A0ABY2F7B2_9ACTN|nr:MULTISPECIES: TetR/AcrR family transcriptional regulator [Kribbella]TDW79572.1 TetR family transcriptional regulator [Kribbella sp. VKM Ac-2566]TDW84269.1 TetR family transcriptional regulator [Kribbella pratensis]
MAEAKGPVWARNDREPRRRTLSRESIVYAAIALADRDGLDAVSIRSVASWLDVRPMSLYGHVSSKDDLLDLMFDQIAGQNVLGDQLPQHWRTALEAIARRTRDQGLAHPWTIELMTDRIQLGPNTLRVLDEWMRAVAPLSVSTEAAWTIVTAVNDYTVGYVIRVVAQRRAVPSDARAAGEWTATVNSYLTERADSGDHPHIAPLLRHGFATQPDSFEAGLSWILDSIEQSHAGPTSAGAAGR